MSDSSLGGIAPANLASSELSLLSHSGRDTGCICDVDCLRKVRSASVIEASFSTTARLFFNSRHHVPLELIYKHMFTMYNYISMSVNNHKPKLYNTTHPSPVFYEHIYLVLITLI